MNVYGSCLVFSSLCVFFFLGLDLLIFFVALNLLLYFGSNIFIDLP